MERKLVIKKLNFTEEEIDILNKAYFILESFYDELSGFDDIEEYEGHSYITDLYNLLY